PPERRHLRGRREAGPEPLRVPAEAQTRHQPAADPRNHPGNSPPSQQHHTSKNYDPGGICDTRLLFEAWVSENSFLGEV
ncbi:MAG: hypothetical protein ACTSUQ_04845, partial [Candidatus Freyarchaeota archaeon]